MGSPVIPYSASSEDLDISVSEVLRYLGYSKSAITDYDKSLVAQLLSEAHKAIRPRGCYSRFQIELLDGGAIRLPYGIVTSMNLSANLRGCKSIYMISATIGAQFDRLMMRERVASMARASVFQAIGSAAVEAFVEKLSGDLAVKAAESHEKLHPRFSPGYGDFALSNQRGIFSLLAPEKHAGITLTDSLLMSPEKSVTALIGIEEI